MTELNRSAATLRLFGDDLVPDEVSRMLGATPTACHAKGEQSLPNVGGRTFNARTGTWRLQAADRCPADLDGQVVELLSQLTPDLEVWSRLAACFRVDVFCGLFLNESNEGVSLSPGTMKALGERSILLDLDVYSNDD